MPRSSSGSFKPPKELLALRDRLTEVFDAGGGADVRPSDTRDVAVRWTPAVDVVANDHEILVSLDVSGLRPEDLAVVLFEQHLTVRGERQQSVDVPRFHRIERARGEFERSLVLPSPADPKGTTAVLSLGVLTIRLPVSKTPISGTHAITVASRQTDR